MSQSRKKRVVKFGGSNLKTREDIDRIVGAIQNYQCPLVVVVSAFYGITNYLTEGIQTARDDRAHITRMKDFLATMKRETIDQNISDPRLADELFEKVSARLDELENFLKGVHYIGEIPDFVQDKILSYGEKFSSLILSSILKSRGLKACEMLPETMGLLTDGAMGNATILYEESRETVKAALEDNQIYVVPGFYGMSPQGKVTLLGRGGSDYSAASLARIINAGSLDVWKDVEGYLSADPSVIPSPRKITHLSYTEAAELSYFGARILHPRTVEPLLEPQIPIRIFNIEKPGQPIDALTIIDGGTPEDPDYVKSVSSSDDFAILSLKGAGVGLKPGILARVTHELEQQAMNIKSVTTSQTRINLYLAREDIQAASRLISRLNLPMVNTLEALDNVAVIALVGDAILDHPGMAETLISAVHQQGIKSRIISVGASEVCAYVVVDKKDKTLALKAIHRAFFEKSS